MTSESTLTYQVYVAPIIAMAGRDVPPGRSRSTWSPISATLIELEGRQLVAIDVGSKLAWVARTVGNRPLRPDAGAARSPPGLDSEAD
jgi:hypothetical protein